MPDRRRRSGYRRGSLPETLTQELDRVQTQVRALEPLEQVRTTGELIAGLDVHLEALAQARFDAIQQLRADGWSYDRLAAATGLSKGRVGQLVRQGRARRGDQTRAEPT